ncbi:MAG: hypothetical protein HDQ98_10385 [Lachnospiraceae bacterium]|nr:hypothetical protein [Lachnospiraceae bacterium]
MKRRMMQFVPILLAALVYAGPHSLTVYAEENKSAETDEGWSVVEIPVNTTVYPNPVNPYQELKVPSQILKLGRYYVIVDTYHDQVIYSLSITAPVREWQVMTSDTKLPHSAASDGEVYLVVDTENNRILVFEWAYGRFQNTQQFENIGERPHYIEYDQETDSFLVWSSMTGEMYLFKKNPQSGRMYLWEIRSIEELEHFYVRSFTICGEQIWFPSGTNGYIIVADKQTFDVIERYPVSPEIAGMAYILPIGEAVYITISTDLEGNQDAATMIRVDDLHALADGQYEEIYDVFDTNGIPYYISNIRGTYYLTNHCGSGQVLRFRVVGNALINDGALF